MFGFVYLHKYRPHFLFIFINPHSKSGFIEQFPI